MALTKEQIIVLFDNIGIDGYGDEEDMHWRADELLLNSVDPEVRDAYKRVVERASWWAYA